MTQLQLQYYTAILNFLHNQRSGYRFCLDNNFYNNALPNISLATPNKIVIGKELSKEVKNKAINVDYDYLFSNCKRCGYKDSANKSHYITI